MMPCAWGPGDNPNRGKRRDANIIAGLQSRVHERLRSRKPSFGLQAEARLSGTLPRHGDTRLHPTAPGRAPAADGEVCLCSAR
jgi:hypothetical protein